MILGFMMFTPMICSQDTAALTADRNFFTHGFFPCLPSMYQTPYHFPQFRTVLHLQVQKVTIQISPAMITGS